MKTEQRSLNGVSVDQLMETIEAVRNDPGLAEFRFRAKNRWIDGTHNRSSIQGFYGCGAEDASREAPFEFDNGEPPILLGDNEGANPVEFILHALAGCLTTTMVAHAAARGIEIRGVESSHEGAIDVQGFLGLDESCPKGYREIDVTMKVDSDADAAQLRELAEFSPVFSTIRNPIQVNLNIETK